MAPLISQDVDSLVGGVSEQPSEIRKDSQVTKADNAILDPAVGMSTRPSTEIVTVNNSNYPAAAEKQLVFTSFDGGPNHRYILKVDLGDTTLGTSPGIVATNVETGVSSTVSVPVANAGYLTKPGGSNADPIIRFAQTGNTVFVANDQKTVSMVTTSESADPLKAVFWFKNPAVNMEGDGLTAISASSYNEDGDLMTNIRFPSAGSFATQSQGQVTDEMTHLAMETFSDSCMQVTNKYDSTSTLWHRAVGKGFAHQSGGNDYGVEEYWKTYGNNSLAFQSGSGNGTNQHYPGDGSSSFTNFTGVTSTYPNSVSHNQVGGYTGRADPWTWYLLGIPNWTSGTIASYEKLGTTQGIIWGEYDPTAILPTSYNVKPLHWRVNAGFESSLVVFSNQKGPRLEDLPPYCPDGFVVPITTDNDSDAEYYYMEYSDYDGAWIEGRKRGEDIALDPSTMPHSLTYDYNTATWSFAEETWKDREVGDAFLHTQPSFVGNNINDILFYKDRLVLASGSSVCMSEINEPKNFWRTSIATILDSDRVDLSLSTGAEGPGLITGVSATSEGLLIFTDRAQHLMSSADLPFVGTNININRLSENPISLYAKPILANDRHFYSTQNGSSSKVWEYTLSEDEGRAVEVTGHCPQFIPNTITHIHSDNLNNTIYFLESSSNNVYVYRHLIADNQRIQAAWSKWTILGAKYSTTINNITYFATSSYITKLRDSSTEDACGWHCYADDILPLDVSTYSYDASLNRSEFSRADVALSGRTGLDHLLDLNSGEMFRITVTMASKYLEGELLPSGHNRNLVWCNPFFLDVELSQFILKTSNSSTTSRVQPILGGRTQLKTLTLYAKDSGPLKVLTDIGGEVEATEHEHTNFTLGGSLNIQPPKDVEFITDIGGRNTETTVKIKSTSSQPVTLTSLRYEVLHHRRGN